MIEVKGKVVVITGGAGALGAIMAQSLVDYGAKVVIISKSDGKAEEFAATLKGGGKAAIGFTGDVQKQSDMDRISIDILAKWGKIDVLINAAGGNLPGATIAPNQTFFDLSIEDFRQVNDLNLMGTVIPCKVFGKIMADAGTGSIINISSMTVPQAVSRVVGYSASKAAMENFTRWLAVEMAMKFGEGIRVNAIAPGFFIGNQNRALLTNDDGSYTDRGKAIINKTPMKRFGEAEELNGVIHWLASDEAKFVTGVVIPIDGGFSAFSGV